MEIINTHLAYFSPTYTTRGVATTVCSRLPGRLHEHDMLSDADMAMPDMGSNDLLVAAVPVYSGRVPDMAADALSRIGGMQTPAIVICVYGNRAYDDALVEMCDMLSNRGFMPIAAATFVARHSIFRSIAANRPDDADREHMLAFASECSRMLSMAPAADAFRPLHVPGSHPYRQPSPPSMFPAGSSKKCSRCMLCANECPVGAVDLRRPYRSNSSVCIACGRCVEICPEHTRRFSGVGYMAALRRMARLCADRREPEAFFANLRTANDATQRGVVR